MNRILPLTLAAVALATCPINGQPTNNPTQLPLAVTNTETNVPHLSTLIRDSSSDETYHGDATNGLGCDLRITRDKYEAGQSVPFCMVFIYNQTTNNFHYLKLPKEALFNIELIDSTGNSVERTIIGQGFENWWTEKHIHDWIHDEVVKGNNRWLSFGLSSNSSIQHGNFSIPRLFKVKLAGEYALHFQIRLVKNIQNASGIHRSITWLPEVVAKVQIRPEDIPLKDLSADSQTNSPGK